MAKTTRTAKVVATAMGMAVVGLFVYGRISDRHKPSGRHDWPAMAAAMDSAPAPSVELRWTLSASPVSPSALGWPATRRNNLWAVNKPGRLQLTLADGRAATFDFFNVDVWRDGSRVRLIDVSFAPGSLDAARFRAAGLLAQWGPQYQASLDAWHDHLERFGPSPQGPNASEGWVAPVPRGVYPSVFVSVQSMTALGRRAWTVHWAVQIEPPKTK